MSLDRFTSFKLDELKAKIDENISRLNELKTLLDSIKSLNQTGNNLLDNIKSLVDHPTSQHFLGEWVLGAGDTYDIFNISNRSGRFLGFQARIYGVSDISFKFVFQIDDPNVTYQYSITDLRIFAGVGGPYTNTYGWINIIEYDTANNYYTLAWLMPIPFKNSFLFRVYNTSTDPATTAIFSLVELY